MTKIPADKRMWGNRSVGSGALLQPSVNIVDSGTPLSLPPLWLLTLRSTDQKSLIFYHKARTHKSKPWRKNWAHSGPVTDTDTNASPYREYFHLSFNYTILDDAPADKGYRRDMIIHTNFCNFYRLKCKFGAVNDWSFLKSDNESHNNCAPNEWWYKYLHYVGDVLTSQLLKI